MDEPSRITALTATRDGNGLAVRVGGKRVATVAMKSASELGLQVGLVWDAALEAAVQRAHAIDAAMRDAMSRLSRRALSRRDLKRKLQQREHGNDVCDAVLDRLEENGLLNDEAYGQALVRETMRAKPAGPRLIQAKLMQKGLDRDLVDRLVREVDTSGDDNFERTLRMARQRWASLQRYDAATRRRRMYGLLARRGFDGEAIDRVMRSLDTEGDSEAGFSG